MRQVHGRSKYFNVVLRDASCTRHHPNLDECIQIRLTLYLGSQITPCSSSIMSQPDTSADPSKDPRAVNRARFELELEFVQSLANPYYLHSLAQQGILNQPAFVNFLKYLLYWKEKEYARFILCVLILMLNLSSNNNA